ncbi:hypothetical protein A45J_1866 [hot springs metagenome]|uniref:Uncharacterized protein n=1 Tax=hot springs metagenome TaxID=433727 RepID=A0A5J4KX08_9ZZZZ
MGRTAKAHVSGRQIITIETDLVDDSINYKFDVKGRKRGGNKDLAPELWDYLFGLYIVDKNDRLVYLYEPMGITPDTLIKTIANDLHPSAEEKFDIVEIIDEDTGDVLKTLKNIDLIGILEGIKEVMEG